ncbi:uncharacterized protein LOC108958747 isoform X3 [Eucalyptus grandis]|uniref:uncharacterized protein LOC108958747 isoform X3 n=1 Tax=Eucalyptus grandis TaxID=71139 RepID=UPI00192EFEC7|nr:uncharacterized protein LOC108958747 isoform X3 [Eucalyptus grandis]
MQRRRWRERVEEGDGGVVRKDERGGWREGIGWTRRRGRQGRRRWWGRRRLWWQNAGIRERCCVVAMWPCPCLLITRLAEKESGSSWRKGHRLEWIPCPRRACYIEVNGRLLFKAIRDG